MRRFYFILLSLLLLVVLSVSVSAAVEGRFTYEEKDGEIILTGATSPITGKLVIPDQINGKPLTRIEQMAFARMDGITALVLPEGLREIGMAAFYQCSGIRELDIPASVEKMEPSAFRECTGIEQLTLHDGPREIEEYVFCNCSSIRELEIPASVEYLETNAFRGCSAVEQLTLHEGLRVVGPYALDLDFQVEGHPDTNIYRVDVPESVECIGERGFGCSRVFGKEYSAAHRYALTFNTGYGKTGTREGYSSYTDEAGNIYWLHNGEAELVMQPRVPERLFLPEEERMLILPERVAGCPLTAIGPYACINESAYHVVVPGSVRTIGAYAFDLLRLKTVFLCEGVASIARYAFSYRNNCTFFLPQSVRTFGKNFLGASMSYQPRAYVYSNSPASSAAQEEGYTTIYADRSDGSVSGSYCGFYFRAQNGTATITSYGNHGRDMVALPGFIDQWPVTGLGPEACKNYSGDNLYIPPWITDIGENALPKNNSVCIRVWPGSYAEQYCRQNGYRYGSIFQVLAVPFTDTAQGAWYYEAVSFAYQLGLMNGVSEKRFAPVNTMSRAMLVQVLYNYAASQAQSPEYGFTDVSQSDWFYRAVNWAAAEGIVHGTSETSFSPNLPITREQLAAMLQRFAERFGLDVSARTSLDGYQDAAKVSSWATDAVAWAKAIGVISGQADGSRLLLAPKGNASRAEAASMLMRFVLWSEQKK